MQKKNETQEAMLPDKNERNYDVKEILKNQIKLISEYSKKSQSGNELCELSNAMITIFRFYAEYL